MPTPTNLKNVIYLSNSDYNTLVSTGTVTIDGTTLTYSDDNVYVTPDTVATTTEDGLMAAADKVKLNSLVTVSASATGTSTTEAKYITIDGTEWKLSGGGNFVQKTGDTMTGSLTLNSGSGYSTSPVISFITPEGNGYLYKNSSALKIGHVGTNNTTYNLTFPTTSGTLATTDDVRNNQMTTVIVRDALHNVNNRPVTAYTAVETSNLFSTGYPGIALSYNGSALTEERAKAYMKYMTGAEFLPVFNYDYPQNVFLIFSDGRIFKPQYDSTNGLGLFYMSRLGVNKYRHNISITHSNTTYATFSFISSQEASYTTLDDLAQALIDNGFDSSQAICPAHGQFYASNKTNLATGVYGIFSQDEYGLGLGGIEIASTSSGTMTVNQTIVKATSATNAYTSLVDIVEEI